MPIWDRLTQDPMSAMLLMSSLQQLPQSMSKQNLPPRGAYAPQGYGQQDGGMGDMVPQMLRMQQVQAQQANMQADNELQRKQFEYAQQAAQQERAMLMKGAEEYAKRAGISLEAAYAAMLGKGGPFADALAERLKPQTVGATERQFIDGEQTVGMAQQYHDGTLIDVEKGTETALPGVRGFQLNKAANGATRVFNQTNVTGNKMAEGVAVSAVKPFDKLTEAATAASSRLEATRALYETAKLYPDLIGPGMELKAGVAEMIEKAKKLADLGPVDPNTQRLLTVARVMEETRGKATTQVMRDLTGNDTDTEWLRTIRQFPGMDDTKLTHDMMFVRAKTESDYLNQKQAYVARKIAEAEASNTFGLTTVSSAEREFEQANPLGDQYAKNLADVLPPSGAAQPRQEMGAPQGATPPPVPRGGAGSLSVDPGTMERVNKPRYSQ